MSFCLTMLLPFKEFIMFQFLVEDATVQIDMENPCLGMGEGAIEMLYGETKIVFPYKVISEKEIKLSPLDILNACSEELRKQNFSLRTTKILTN